jgi:multidrug transporter EmrE-like cation transporter
VAAGIAFSLLAAVVLNIGNIVQKHAVTGLSDLSVRRSAHLFRTLITSRTWILGLSLCVLGVAFQIMAFALAPIPVVQAIFNAGLVLLLVLSRVRIGERFQRGEWIGLAVVAVSLVAIGASLADESSAVGLTHTTWRIVAAAFPTLLIAFVVMLCARTRWGRSGFLAGIASGLLYGLATLGTKGASTLVVDNGVVASIPKILTSVYPYVFLVFCLLGMVVYQTGIQRHRIAIVGSMNEVVGSTYVVVVGTIVFGESLPTDHVVLALRAFGFAGVLVGSILLVLGGRDASRVQMPLADADLGLGPVLVPEDDTLVGHAIGDLVQGAHGLPDGLPDRASPA